MLGHMWIEECNPQILMLSLRHNQILIEIYIFVFSILFFKFYVDSCPLYNTILNNITRQNGPSNPQVQFLTHAIILKVSTKRCTLRKGCKNSKVDTKMLWYIKIVCFSQMSTNNSKLLFKLEFFNALYWCVKYSNKNY